MILIEEIDDLILKLKDCFIFLSTGVVEIGKMCRMENVVNNFVNEKVPPPAPPLPCFLSAAYPKKVMVKSKSKAKMMSSYKEQCNVSTATTDLYDRLFDEAYRADVVVHTDNGGQIYAHASILVRSFKTYMSFCILFYNEIRLFSSQLRQMLVNSGFMKEQVLICSHQISHWLCFCNVKAWSSF